MKLNDLSQIRNNSIVIFASQITSLILNILSISLAARYLGVEDFGKFNYLLAIVGIGAKVLDFGFNPIVFRELSRNNEVKRYLGTVFIFRTTIIILIVFMFGIFGLLLNLEKLEILLICLLSFNILFSNKFTNIRELLTIPFKVELKMYIPMLFVILDNILLLVFVISMPYLNGGILYFSFIYLISNIPGTLLLFYFLYKNFKPHFYFNLNELKYLYKESLPLMGFIIVAFLYVQIDILLLKNLSGAASVGIYSSALRLIVPLKLFPNVLVITLFPLLVKNVNNRNYNQQIVKFVSKLFFLFAISFSVFMFIGSRDVILLVFGEKYVEASVALKVLSLGIFFDFFSFFILDLFTAYNKQKYNLQFILFVTIIVLLTNIILIPQLDFVGSSLSRIISGLFGFIFLLSVLRKEIKINMNFLSLRLLLSTLIFILSILLLKGFYPIINFLISIAVFILSIFLLRVFTINEMKIILQLVSNKRITSIFSKYYKIWE